MFERCSLLPNPNRELMIQTIEHEILPAMAAKDWDRFDMALGRYGRWAGKIFEPVQGGVYRSPQIAHCIDVAIKLGLRDLLRHRRAPSIWGMPEPFSWLGSPADRPVEDCCCASKTSTRREPSSEQQNKRSRICDGWDLIGMPQVMIEALPFSRIARQDTRRFWSS